MPDAGAAIDPGGFRLHGQRALVTGASTGIGAEIATTLAAAGADVVLSARARSTGDPLTQLAGRLEDSYTGRVAVVPADLSDAAAVEELAGAAWKVWDGLELLVNNAGVSYPERVVDVTAARWDAVMAVNLRAPALLAARLGRDMAAAGGGCIVNIASVAGLRALAEHYAYCASKAGLVMATKVLALELGPAGVRTNVICPTVVMTEMGQRVWGEQAKAAPMLSRIPLGSFAQPADVAGAVLYLASPHAAMVNGAEIVLDGGFTVA